MDPSGQLTAADDFGDPAWIRDLYGRLTRLTDDPDVLGVAAAGAGHGLSLSGHQREAFELLRRSLEEHRPRDGSTALALTGVLAAVRIQSGLPEQHAPLTALVGRVHDDDPDATPSGCGRTPPPRSTGAWTARSTSRACSASPRPRGSPTSPARPSKRSGRPVPTVRSAWS